MNSATTQPLLHDSPEGCHGAEAGSHRPRPTTDPFFFVWRDSDFFFRYGGGEARSGFSKGETGGIQMRTPLAEYGDNPKRKNTPCIFVLAGVKFLLKKERVFFLSGLYP